MTAWPQRLVRVEVPATTANMGPGFDCMGAALSLSNSVEARFAREPEIVLEGEYARGIRRDSDNLVYRAAASVLERCGVRDPLRIRIDCRVPPARGLGSSAASIVGGMFAANALLDAPLSLDDLLKMASLMEGHPDNVVPAVLGGLTLAAMDGDVLLYKRMDLPPGLVVVVAIPDFQLSTAAARCVVPSTVPMRDATFNLARAAMMAVCLSEGDLSMLSSLCRDRLHQPYRSKLVPGLEQMVDGVAAYGALACYLSGAGPSVACLTAEDRADEVGGFLVDVFARHGIGSERRTLYPCADGVKVLTEDTPPRRIP